MVIRDWLLHWITTKHGRKSFSRPPKDVWNLKGKCLGFLPRNEGVYFVTFNLLNGWKKICQLWRFTCIFSVTGHHGIWLEGSMARSCEYSFRPLGSETAGEKWADPDPRGRWKFQPITGQRAVKTLHFKRGVFGMVPKKGVGKIFPVLDDSNNDSLKSGRF